MSVRRYEFEYCQSVDCNHGRFVLHSDYAALLARHNALADAVKLERASYSEHLRSHDSDGHDLMLARAEVDRLLGEDKG